MYVHMSPLARGGLTWPSYRSVGSGMVTPYSPIPAGPAGAARPALAPLISAGPDAPVIVVVEDDESVRMMLARLLGQKYTVYVASDGMAALDLLAQAPIPDAMVLDVMMPLLDGLTLGRAVRKDPRLAHVPIIYLTAKNSALDIVAGINAGARHYITKPFSGANLLARVDALLSHS
jgi:CheY-like chemotaxis protein